MFKEMDSDEVKGHMRKIFLFLDAKKVLQMATVNMENI